MAGWLRRSHGHLVRFFGDTHVRLLSGVKMALASAAHKKSNPRLRAREAWTQYWAIASS